MGLLDQSVMPKLGRPKGSYLTHCKRGHELAGDNVYVWRENRRCRACRVEYNRVWWASKAIGSRKGYKWKHGNQYQRAHNQKRKEMLLDLRGGKCIDCGFNQHPAALHFDHRDPSQKSFNIGSSVSRRTWSELVIEAEKCDIRCANCHAMKTWGTRTVWEYRNKKYAHA